MRPYTDDIFVSPSRTGPLARQRSRALTSSPVTSPPEEIVIVVIITVTVVVITVVLVVVVFSLDELLKLSPVQSHLGILGIHQRGSLPAGFH